MSPKKTSMAETLRQRAALAAERATPTEPLPETFVAWLRNDYQPALPMRPLWPTLRPAVEEILSMSRVRGEEALRKTTTHLLHYLAWRQRRELPLSALVAMNRRDVDDYTTNGMPDSSAKSRSDRRSRLRALCDNLNPDQAPHHGVVVPRQAVKPPYTTQEVTALGRAITVQPTPDLTRSTNLCFGLGAGAGIDSPDLKLLDTTHVTDLGEQGIRVDVPGDRARTVWVLREFEPFVRAGLQGLRPGQPLVGRLKTRRNVAAAIYADTVLLGGLPKLEQSRLRITWLATLMSRPIPLGVILTAAGLRSSRTIFDLLPHLTTTLDVAADLRGGAR